MKDKKVLYVLPHLRTGAVPKILLDIIPVILKRFQIEILVIGKTNTNSSVYKKLKASELEVHELNINKYLIPLRLKKVSTELEKINPDIIHSHLGLADIVSAILKKSNTKLVSTFHNVREGYNNIIEKIYHFTDHNVDYRTCVSIAVENSWYKHGKLSSNCEVIYNPVNIDVFSQKNSERRTEIRNQLGIPINAPLLLNVGSLTKQKGQEVLIKSFRDILENHPDAHLLIAGKGPLEIPLTKLINKFGINKNVHLLGFRDDINELLNAADIFVFPSLWEGLGIAVLEAMAAKVPVVATSCEALAEYLQHNVNSYLSDPGEVKGITNNINKCLLNYEHTNMIVENAYLDTVNKFDKKIISEKYLDIYFKVLQS